MVWCREPSVLRAEFEPADADVAQRLNVREGAQTLRLDRLRLASDQPVALMYAHLAAWCGLTPDLDYTGSMHQLLNQRGIKVVDADQIIEATVATVEQAKALGYRRNGPLLRVDRVTISADGRPVERVVALYRADRYSFRMSLSLGGRVVGMIQSPQE